jgi:hypothetical protein
MYESSSSVTELGEMPAGFEICGTEFCTSVLVDD